MKSVKKLTTALNEGIQASELATLLSHAASQLAKAKNKGVLHENTASRKLSRLAHKVSVSTR